MLCPRVEHCYCAGYGLCFESGGETKAWLAMREAEWLGQRMMEGWKEGEEMGEKRRLELEERLTFRMQRPLDQWIKEARWRGSDPVQRAELGGQERGS